MKVRNLKTEMKKREKEDLYRSLLTNYPFIESMRSIDFQLTQGLVLMHYSMVKIPKIESFEGSRRFRDPQKSEKLNFLFFFSSVFMYLTFIVLRWQKEKRGPLYSIFKRLSIYWISDAMVRSMDFQLTQGLVF